MQRTKFSNQELEEIYSVQYGELVELDRKLDSVLPYKYFLNYSVAGLERANLENLLGLHRRHSIKIANHIRAHFLPILLIPVNGEREHLHVQGRSDVPIPIEVFRKYWGVRSHGNNVFRNWDDSKDGQTYFFKRNQWVDTIYPYCGSNKKPCRTKKGNRCIHRYILDELRQR